MKLTQRREPLNHKRENTSIEQSEKAKVVNNIFGHNLRRRKRDEKLPGMIPRVAGRTAQVILTHNMDVRRRRITSLRPRPITVPAFALTESTGGRTLPTKEKMKNRTNEYYDSGTMEVAFLTALSIKKALCLKSIKKTLKTVVVKKVLKIIFLIKKKKREEKSRHFHEIT